MPAIDDWSEVDAVAVTEGPGLAGSLLVGITMAKTLAWSLGLPLVPVNHLEGHIYAAWLLDPDEEEKPAPEFPLVALVVSGGHTFIVEMAGPPHLPAAGPDRRRRRRRGLRQGRPPAGALVPGRPGHHEGRGGRDARTIAASRGPGWATPTTSPSPGSRPRRGTRSAEALGLPQESASSMAPSLREADVAELAWAFQESVVDVLATKTLRAARELGASSIILGGGVAANAVLRERIDEGARGLGVPAGRAATGPVHRQRGHDRRGRLPPPCRPARVRDRSLDARPSLKLAV